jgi:predicted Zn-dependent peptidase
MNPQTIQTHRLPNGLTLVVEEMPNVQSASFSILVPAGSVYDPPGHNGTASILSDMLTRGAGERDSKQLSMDLDNLGVQRHESASINFISIGGATIAENLPTALRIYGDVILKPHLPADQFPASMAGAEQALRSLDDEPRQKVILELRRRCYDSPWGLPSEGDLEGLKSNTADSVRAHHERCFLPEGTIIGVAGKISFAEIAEVVEEVFGEWQTKPAPTFETVPHKTVQDHIHHDSTQTHIGIAYNSVPYKADDYYAAWAAVGVLSGGMSSRLFTEVREKRGLCYSVFASLNSLPDEGRVLCYAGTTTERAQETLDVTLQELVRLKDGIEDRELDRCKARAKSSLIMQQESTGARASSIARDWYHLGEIRTLEVVREKIESLTVPQVLEHVNNYPARDFTILTIGPEALEVNVEVS